MMRIYIGIDKSSLQHKGISLSKLYHAIMVYQDCLDLKVNVETIPVEDLNLLDETEKTYTE